MAAFQILPIIVVCFCVWFCLSSGQGNPDKALVWTLWPEDLNMGAKIRTISVMPGYESTSGIRSLGIRFYTKDINFISADVDFRERRIFLYDTFLRAIVVGSNFSSQLDVSEMLFQYFHRGVGGSKTQLAVDYVSHTVYWTDPTFKSILAAPGLPEKRLLDYYKTIVRDDLSFPSGIALDPNGTLFFSDVGDNPKIERTDLDGANRKRLITHGLVYPHALDWDHWDQRLYWVDTELSAIYWTKADGSGTTFVRRFHGAELFDIAVFKNVLYATDIGTDRDGMYTINKTTTLQNHVKLGVSDETVEALAIFNIEAQPMVKDYCKDLNCSHLCVSRAGGATCLCSDGFKLANDSRSCEEDTGAYHRAIVFSTNNSICMGNVRMITSTYFEPICILFTADSIPTTTTTTSTTAAPTVPSKNPTTPSSGSSASSSTPTPTAATTMGTTSRPRVTASLPNEKIMYLDIDMEERVIYFLTNVSLYKIPVPVEPDQRDSLIPEHLLDLTGTPSGLVFDWIDDNLYWTQGDTGSVFIYSLDRELAREIITGQIQPTSLLLLPHQRQLMWIAGTSGSYTIKKASMDENNLNIEDIIPSTRLTDPVSLVRDKEKLRFFWFERSTSSVMSANLDGSGITKLKDSNQTTYFLHSYKNFLIWLTVNGTSGTSVMNVYNRDIRNTTVTGLEYDYITDGRVLDVSVQPSGPHPCNELNNDCDQICYTLDSTENGQMVKQCLCQEGYTLTNGTKCIPTPIEDQFLLVGDRALGEIFQISLDGQNVQAVSKPDDGLPTGVLYDSVQDRVIYGVEGDNTVYAVSLKGQNYVELGEILDPQSFPYRFALDNTTGNLYYTTRGRKSLIGVVIRSWASKSHMTLYGDDAVLLSDIVVHPGRGFMFWSEYNTTVARIRRAWMNGTHVTTIISSFEVIRWPDGLSIDYKNNTLYFADEYHDTVSRCDFNGLNIVKLKFDQNAYILDVVVGDSFVYYTATNKLRINKINIQNSSDVSTVHENARLGRLEAIDMYSSISTNLQPVSTGCQPNRGLGDCGSICFPIPGGHTCACLPGEYLLENNTCNNEYVCSIVTLHNSARLSPGCGSRLNETCRITCVEGFDTLIEQTTCTLSGWDVGGRQQCKAITCSKQVPGVYIFDNCTTTSYQETCGYSCPHGYKPRTNAAVCQANGQWAAECVAIKCPKVVPHVTFDNQCDFGIGKACSFTCDPGFRNVSASVPCLSDGTWSSAFCEEITCAASPVPHLTFDTSCSYKQVSPCGYSCAEGYTKTKSSATCDITGNWPLDLCTVVTCPETIARGKLENGCTLRYGAECRVTCNKGWEEAVVKCLGTGNWNNTQLCAEVPKVLANTQDKMSDSKGPLIGGLVGGIVVAIVIAVGIVLFVLYRRRHQKLVEETSPRAVYDGGSSNIAIENPGYMAHHSIEQPQQVVTMSEVKLEAISRPTSVPERAAAPRATLREERTLEIPDQDLEPEEGESDDVVLTKDSWLKEQAKIQKALSDA